MTLIKVCRIRDFATARSLVWQGVDLLGLHFIDADSLKTNNPLVEVNRRLVDELKFDGGVLLTKCLDLDLVLSVLKAGRFRYLQVHAQCTSSELQRLRVLVDQCQVKLIVLLDPEVATTDEAERIYSIADLVLADHVRGGTGSAIDTTRLRQTHMHKTLIAGGLDAGNVAGIVSRYQPAGVDVQTYTESVKGTKDLQRTGRFIAALRPKQPLFPVATPGIELSLSVARINNLSWSIRRAVLSESDTLHIDYSVSDALSIPSLSFDEIIQITNGESRPVSDVHFFADAAESSKLVNEILEAVPLVRSCYVHLVGPIRSGAIHDLIELIAAKRVRPGLAFDAHTLVGPIQRQATGCIPPSVQDVLIVGPSSQKEVKRRGRMFKEAIQAIREVRDHYPRIMVDRGIDLTLLNDLPLNHLSGVVVGAAVIDSSSPIESLVELRGSFVGI